MLIADVVFAVSQSDFPGSKICQGTHTQLGAAILTPMCLRAQYLRLTSGTYLVTISPGDPMA